MVRIILSIICIFIFNGNTMAGTSVNGNETTYIPNVQTEQIQVPGFTHPGLFLFRGSLAVGGMTKLNAKNVFVEGNVEYFLDRRVSIRGDGYFFANHSGDYKPFKMHHSLFTGAMFHKYTKGDFDPYLGIEVGINYAQATDPYLGGTGSIAVVPVEEASKTFSPLFSPLIGFNYFGGKFFHITMHARYIMGKFMDNYNSVSLGEWRISFGLGFNISRQLMNRPPRVIRDF